MTMQNSARASRRLRSLWPKTKHGLSAELNAVQGKPVDIGGYYAPNPDLATKAMRPSQTFNAALMSFSAKSEAIS